VLDCELSDANVIGKTPGLCRDLVTRRLSKMRLCVGILDSIGCMTVRCVPSSVSPNMRRFRIDFGGELCGPSSKGAYFARWIGSYALPNPRYRATVGCLRRLVLLAALRLAWFCCTKPVTEDCGVRS
jgi:hypothetical protein